MDGSPAPSAVMRDRLEVIAHGPIGARKGDERSAHVVKPSVPKAQLGLIFDEVAKKRSIGSTCTTLTGHDQIVFRRHLFELRCETGQAPLSEHLGQDRVDRHFACPARLRALLNSIAVGVARNNVQAPEWLTREVKGAPTER